tara:strand:+ start:5984 stop:7606 length:1623 start_codon:yes stop_codon:yes gene_type:complete
MRGTYDIGWGKQEPATPFTFSVGEDALDPTRLVTSDHLVLLAPSADFPYVYDYAEIVDWSDWLSDDVPAPGLALLNSAADPIEFMNVTTVAGVGDHIVHHETPNATVQTTDVVALRAVLEVDTLDAAMAFKLARCGGVTAPTTADENTLYGLELREPDEIRAGHESGTNVAHTANWKLLGPLSGATYDICATRDGSGEWRCYLDGYPLNFIDSTQGGSASDGVFTPSAAAANGGDSVYCVERVEDVAYGKTRLHLSEAMATTLTDGEVAGRVISTRDARVAAWALDDDALIAEMYSADDDVFFVLAASGAAPNLNEVKGDYSGSWTDQPADVKAWINGAAFGRDAGGTGWALNHNDVVGWAGGADYIWRSLHIWGEGDGLAAARRLMSIFDSGTTSGENICNLLVLQNQTTIRWFQQHGSKDSVYADWTIPFTPKDGDPLLITVGQEDAASGFQRIRVWVNGVACAVAAVYETAVDNGDGSVTMEDGLANASDPELTLGGVRYSTGSNSYWRCFQLTTGTTDTTAEAALATALFGKTGQL